MAEKIRNVKANLRKELEIIKERRSELEDDLNDSLGFFKSVPSILSAYRQVVADFEDYIVVSTNECNHQIDRIVELDDRQHTSAKKMIANIKKEIDEREDEAKDMFNGVKRYILMTPEILTLILTFLVFLVTLAMGLEATGYAFQSDPVQPPATQSGDKNTASASGRTAYTLHRTVFFGKGKHEVDANGQAVIRTFLDEVTPTEPHCLTVVSYADGVSGERYTNERILQERANSTLSYIRSVDKSINVRSGRGGILEQPEMSEAEGEYWERWARRVDLAFVNKPCESDTTWDSVPYP